MTLLSQFNKVVLHEAGGDAARSAYFFLKDYGWKPENIIAVDSSEKPLRFWKEVLETNVCLQDNYRHFSSNLIFPCDEYYRVENNHTNTSLSDLGFYDLDKLYLQKELECNADFFSIKKFYIPEIPKVLIPHKKYVQRKRVSSGSKDLKIDYGKNLLDINCSFITEYIEFEKELVVDFTKDIYDNISICPRITYNLKNGADTHYCIIGHMDIGYNKILDVVKFITKSVNYHGIGNIQLGLEGDNLYFIEMSPRLSGASYVNLDVGWNPIRIIENVDYKWNNNLSIQGSTKFPSEKFVYNWDKPKFEYREFNHD